MQVFMITSSPAEECIDAMPDNGQRYYARSYWRWLTVSNTEYPHWGDFGINQYQAVDIRAELAQYDIKTGKRINA